MITERNTGREVWDSHDAVWCIKPTLFLEELIKMAKPLDRKLVSDLILRDDNDQNMTQDAYPFDDDVRLRGPLRTK
jgi:hypothetical protein